MNRSFDPFYEFGARESRTPVLPSGSEVVFQSESTPPQGQQLRATGAVFREPFYVELNSSGQAQILSTTASYLHANYLAASGMSITALNTAFTLSSTTHAWIEVTVSSLVVATAAQLKTGSAFPEPFMSSGGVQTKYNIPVGRVVSGLQPGMTGFDFVISSTEYHWQQMLRDHQMMEHKNFSGVPGLTAVLWTGI